MKGWACYGLAVCAFAGPARAQGCGRPAPGNLVVEPQDVFSSDGVLNSRFSFRSAPTRYGFTRYCYVYGDGDGAQSPTLRVRPGDELALTLKNDIPPGAAAAGHVHASERKARCAGGEMNEAVTNLHFHG